MTGGNAPATEGVETMTSVTEERRTIGKTIFDCAAGLAFAVAVGGLSLLFAPAPSVAQSDTLIVPGQRVGPIQFGMQPGDVVRALGQPSKIITPPHGGLRYDYDYDGRYVIVNFSAVPETEVYQVITSDPRYATREGIRVGSSGGDVVRAYGRNYSKSSNSVCYAELGFWFGFSPHNNIRNLAVYAPGVPFSC